MIWYDQRDTNYPVCHYSILGFSLWINKGCWYSLYHLPAHRGWAAWSLPPSMPVPPPASPVIHKRVIIWMELSFEWSYTYNTQCKLTNQFSGWFLGENAASGKVTVAKVNSYDFSQLLGNNSCAPPRLKTGSCRKAKHQCTGCRIKKDNVQN